MEISPTHLPTHIALSFVLLFLFGGGMALYGWCSESLPLLTVITGLTYTLQLACNTTVSDVCGFSLNGFDFLVFCPWTETESHHHRHHETTTYFSPNPEAESYRSSLPPSTFPRATALHSSTPQLMQTPQNLTLGFQAKTVSPLLFCLIHDSSQEALRYVAVKTVKFHPLVITERGRIWSHLYRAGFPSFSIWSSSI